MTDRPPHDPGLPGANRVGGAEALKVSGLQVTIGGVPAVDGVDLTVHEGETVALVGESGCGKSMTALAIMGLHPDAATITAGTITAAGMDLVGLDDRSLRDIRGNVMAMIFQEPVSSLNPLMRVGEQIVEALQSHQQLGRKAAHDRAISMLEQVGIPDPASRFRQYPFELSGGMCQRVMIAIALICQPAVLIADEPTTALDVTIQAQILDLMRRLKNDTGAALLLITHDMGVVADMADTVAVMYAGRVVETAPVRALFRRQYHPYTHLLLQTIPKIDGARKHTLNTIEGTVPDLRDWPTGCRFNPRCPLAAEKCRVQAPPLASVGGDPGHASACWFADQVESMA
ncbi:ABC transporter ATP-binding protein [Fodinicurvata sp. EGI_FJ10296]|uniref:ABC transporter ATP-binding protein n=1 Tax=Fodinicurvata sp. EGI_FJ10296 TaxID=3231908 RepID=UPI0034520214